MSGKRTRQSGFTIVELLIVIVVIAILATISIVAYSGIQARANDSKIRAAVNQFEKALGVWVVDHPAPLRGGANSTIAVSNGACSDGAEGWLAAGNYVCSMDDALISAGNLPTGFLRNLPRNTYLGATDGRYATMLYWCGTNRYSLYWTLQNPTAEDSASIDATLTTCGDPVQIRDSWGMRAGKTIQF
jgi:prepilin-type N-terminal cleavage/methylation domain-containing protein